MEISPPRPYLIDDLRPNLAAIELVRFAEVQLSERVIDLGCGNGVMLFMLAERVAGLVATGIDIQPGLIEIAIEFARNFPGQFNWIVGDYRTKMKPDPANSFDLVLVNPPYFPVGDGVSPQRDEVRLARQEVSATLDDTIQAAHKWLRPGGRLYMIHLWSRREEILTRLRGHGFKLIKEQKVVANPAGDPLYLLIEGVRTTD